MLCLYFHKILKKCMEESVRLYNQWQKYGGPGLSLRSDNYSYQGPKTISLLNNHFSSY